MKVTAGGSSSDSSSSIATLMFTPPEVLLDTPFNMGCYKIKLGYLNEGIEQELDTTPASCVTKCAEKSSFHRLAGILKLYENFMKLHIHYYISTPLIKTM